MEVSHQAERSMTLPVPVEIAAADLSDREVITSLVAPLLGPGSDVTAQPQRWELPGLTVAGIGVHPAVHARLEPGRRSLTVRGTPVEGRTRSWLDVHLEVQATSPTTCRLTARFEARGEAPLPRLARPIAERVLRHEVEKVVRRLMSAISDHAQQRAAEDRTSAA